MVRSLSDALTLAWRGAAIIPLDHPWLVISRGSPRRVEHFVQSLRSSRVDEMLMGPPICVIFLLDVWHKEVCLIDVATSLHACSYCVPLLRRSAMFLTL